MMGMAIESLASTLEAVKNRWTWIPFRCEGGLAAMDLDRELLERVKGEGESPVLRFYQWQKPALSYGRTQGIDSETKKRFIADGWETVQRPSGGGHVLHGNDLCFTLIWKKQTPALPWKILDSYRAIHSWIRSALEKMGIQTVLQEMPKDGFKNQNTRCFQSPVSHDLMLRDKKIVGGAQWRSRDVALHQGSIQMKIDPMQVEVFKTTFQKMFNVVF